MWSTPPEALRRYWSSEIELAPPQIMSLAHLSHYPTVKAALPAARRRLPPVLAPGRFMLEGLRPTCIPGDERDSGRERALPGPSRLSYRNRRFEPDGGFEARLTPAPDEFAAP